MSKALEKKYMQFEFKAESMEEHNDIGYLKGYASAFSNVDQGFDVVDKGAFAKTIADKRGKFPILLDHDVTKQIGWNLKASEDDYGLKVEGEIKLITEDARNRYALTKQAMSIGASSGLSIGYSVIKAEPDYDRPIIRHLKELKLWEYSMVTFPMNEAANVTSMKCLKKIFAELSERGYSEIEIQEALTKTDLLPDRSKPPSKLHEPELIHSLDKLLNLFKS